VERFFVFQGVVNMRVKRVFWLLMAMLAATAVLIACDASSQEGEETPVMEGTAEVEDVVSEVEPLADEDDFEGVTLRLMTHDSFAISESVIDQFQEETGATVEIFRAGDAGAVLNQAILAKDDPLADVLFGVDNTFLSRALENEIFIPYESPLLASIDDSMQLDDESRALPVDYGDVCLNYDKAWFAEAGIEPPQTLSDLTAAAYRDLTVVENPATSSPGLAFLLATIDTFGEDGYLDFWRNLRDNGVLVTNGWEDAYYGHFTAASDGDRPIVVSYASSPPAEVYFAEEELEEAPTAAVTGDGSCFRQIEFVGILRGTEQEEAAQALVDFMLSPTFQEDIPLNMFVYPANENADLPQVFTNYSVVPENPATVDPAAIDQNREEWLEAWTETVIE
jgi:thiamine transport system substrate-binding protein